MVEYLRPRRANIPKLVPKRRLNGRPIKDPRRTRRWSTWSKWIRRRHPICQRCNGNLSDHVHHVVAIADNPERCFDPSNVVALCRQCHFKVHRGAPLNATPSTAPLEDDDMPPPGTSMYEFHGLV